ncbi:MAG: ABC transporter ATP-binding protein [Coxiellaceae bacterium]|nr:ABC transporter ATP-binding protein [Coxiellaceae bacterium]
MQTDTLLDMPAHNAPPRQSTLKDIRNNFSLGARTFLMSDLWPLATAPQKRRLFASYFANIFFSALQPISAILLSQSLQAIASQQTTVPLFGLNLKPKTSLYLYIAFIGISFSSDYFKSRLLFGITNAIEKKRVKQVVTQYNQAPYQEHMAMQPQATEVLTNLMGADQAIKLASVANMQPPLFNLIAATLAAVLLEHKSLTWVIVPYIITALVIKELIHSCVRNKTATTNVGMADVLKRFRPSPGKAAMMKNFGRENLETKITDNLLATANQNSGVPKWHQNYRLLLGIITFGLSFYYIESVAEHGLEPSNIGQVTYMLSYLASLYSSFSSFNQSVGDVKDSFSAIKGARLFSTKLSETQAQHHPTSGNGDARQGLEFRDVDYQYSTPSTDDSSPQLTHPTVKGINLAIPKGELVVLSGPSRSGRSTLAKLAAGLNNPTRGDIFVNGQNLAAMSPSDRTQLVAYVPQTPKLQGDKSVLYHMLYTICDDSTLFDLKDLTSRELQDRLTGTDEYRLAIETLVACGIEPALLHQHESSLAGSDHYRLSLAMAFAQKTDIIIIDQMFANFDDETQHRLAETIKSMGTKTRLIISNVPGLFDDCQRIQLNDRGQLDTPATAPSARK